jgi:hypothetical protein
MIDLAVVKEVKGAQSGKYPPNWPEVARLIKQRAEWKCERCGRPHDIANGFTLTVHHLDGDKWNLEWWNLAALCQRCHLRIQARVDWWQDNLDGRHASWMADHVIGYNIWASINGKPELKMGQTYNRDYSKEWSVLGKVDR